MANLRLTKRAKQSRKRDGKRGTAAWIAALSGFVGALGVAGVTERGIVVSVALVLLTIIISTIIAKGGH